MMKKERHSAILKLLEVKKFITVTEIAKLLNVSPMTIRRDVKELGEQKELLRLYGGVQFLDKKEKEYSTDEKINNHIDRKKHIGKVMNNLISDNSTIYVGAGTTIYYALAELTKENLFIITNSLIAFNYLVENTQHKIVLTGGDYNKNTQEFVGKIAEKSFDNLNIDIGFCATNGIYHDNITTSNTPEGDVQIKALEHSKVKVVVADSSKFNVSDSITFYNLSDMDILITDHKVTNQIFEYYSNFVKILN